MKAIGYDIELPIRLVSPNYFQFVVLTAAAIQRYRASVFSTTTNHSNNLRTQSVNLFMFSMYLIILEFISRGLHNILVSFSSYLDVVSAMIVIALSAWLSKIEFKWIQYYNYNLAPKASFLITAIGIFSLLSLSINHLLIMVLQLNPFISLIILSSSFIGAIYLPQKMYFHLYRVRLS